MPDDPGVVRPGQDLLDVGASLRPAGSDLHRLRRGFGQRGQAPPQAPAGAPSHV